ncbi:MAG TPA: peptidase S10 [Pirellulales bacterium]|jgi:carboxypeptidase C (cathepsin A)|nr:peptidase S10 [Pirellulales bacterium]
MKAIPFVLVLFMSLPVMAQRPREPQPAAENPAAAPARGESSRADQPRTTEPRTEAPRSQEPRTPSGRQRQSENAELNMANPPVAEKVDEKPIVTHHKITVGGKTLEYTATVAQMPIKDNAGETEAHIFYMAYTLDNAGEMSKRPLTFAFNGGPGSASIWVHMGAMGPRNAKLLDNGDMPPPPFQLIDNEHTWLDQTDLVFIDPVGTGYSRAKNTEIARRLNGVQGDLQSVGEFIRMYITRNDRWLSPLFIAGESYGTFRAAGLAGTLIERGIAVNGIVLISTVLDFGMLRPSVGNGLPYALHLPTCAADAWYHKKLAPELQQDLRATLKEVEGWAMSEYLAALNKGDELPPSERKTIVEKLARYTGLSRRYVEESDLRINTNRFQRELLRDKKLTIGGYDGRLTGPSPLDAGDGAEFDPSGTLVRPPFEAAFQHYIQSELGYKTDMVYNVLGGIMPWDWGSRNNFAETTSLLRNAFTKNPYLKVLVCAGYYDIVTPYYSVEYTLNHTGLHPQMQKNISYEFYEAGHMMYIDRPSHEKLKRDITEFITKATAKP